MLVKWHFHNVKSYVTHATMLSPPFLHFVVLSLLLLLSRSGWSKFNLTPYESKKKNSKLFYSRLLNIKENCIYKVH